MYNATPTGAPPAPWLVPPPPFPQPPPWFQHGGGGGGGGKGRGGGGGKGKGGRSDPDRALPPHLARIQAMGTSFIGGGRGFNELHKHNATGPK